MARHTVIVAFPVEAQSLEAAVEEIRIRLMAGVHELSYDGVVGHGVVPPVEDQPQAVAAHMHRGDRTPNRFRQWCKDC